MKLKFCITELSLSFILTFPSVSKTQTTGLGKNYFIKGQVIIYGGGGGEDRKGLGKQNFVLVKGWVNEKQNTSRFKGWVIEIYCHFQTNDSLKY